MKACPVCGLDLEDTYLFCPEDGSPLQRPDTSILSTELHEDRIEQSPINEPNLNAPGHVVLYCPACAAEYPLTFSNCPVHGVPLTKHSIATFVNTPARTARHISEPRMPQPPMAERRTPINQEAQSAASLVSLVTSDHLESMPVEAETVQEPLIITDQTEDQVPGYERSQALAEEAAPEPKSFRIAAIMIIVGLAALSLMGFYALYSNISRKHASLAARPADKSLAFAPETELIPTPQAALDYKEEPAAPHRPEPAGAGDETLHDREPAHTAAAAPVRIAARQDEEKNLPSASSHPPPATQTPVTVRKPASATDLVLPRGTYGLVDARLVRMRARQTPSGYRYDLTFNLQEQAGRVAQYDRLAVVTHSASGINHSEVMPFSHRLGAAGDLTFTVSVELKGRSEPDWQGRIICTTSGTDNQGRPLRTSF
ncbi:MAG TPA: hypothetical protein VF762_24960, partial [Blastocatellia bacterium]